MANKYVTEILDEINEDPSLLKTKYKDNAAVRLIMEYAFNPELKFDLPAGDPPFKEAAEPLGMTPTNIYQEVRKFDKFTKQRELKPLIRERVFITLLEGLHPTEAKLVLHIKEQKLQKLYKGITHKRAYDAGLVTVAPKKRAAPKKSGQTAKKTAKKPSQTKKNGKES